MFIAIARIPSHPDAVGLAAAATGLSRADASRLLAGTLPRILVRQTADEGAMVAALEAAGFVAFAGDAAAIPSDADRVVARDLELLPDGLVALDGCGQRHEMPVSAITALLRGIRPVLTSEIIKTTERKLAVGKALLTGGLSVTRKVETVSERTTSAKEFFLLIQGGSGRPEILIDEHRCSYQCLGRDLQPSALGNQAALLTRLRSLAPAAPVDDRMLRPGFLAGLPPLGADPVDLAIFLIAAARACGL